MNPSGTVHSDLLANYDPGGFFDELFGGSGNPAEHTSAIRQRLSTMDFADLQRRAKDAERELYNLGITFTVYSDQDAIDRILPFDVIPRVISAGNGRRSSRRDPARNRAQPVPARSLP